MKVLEKRATKGSRANAARIKMRSSRVDGLSVPIHRRLGFINEKSSTAPRNLLGSDDRPAIRE
jgi:hypothetical protein